MFRYSNAILALPLAIPLLLISEAGRSQSVIVTNKNGVTTITSQGSAPVVSPLVQSAVSAANNCIQISSIEQLQSIGGSTGPITGSYCLSRDIDASITKTWNGGAGFIPIGYSAAITTNSTVPTYGPLVGVNATPRQFVGTFDGQGHTISNLFIKNVAAFNLGLFSWIGPGGVVRNVGLVTGSLTVGGGYQNFGLLAGWNLGTITTSYASGSVSGGDNAGTLGGLVGWNWGGTIANSYATSNVRAGVGAYRIGGLAGFNGYYLNGGGTIANSYATGTVTAGINSSTMGGLVGDNNSAVISNSYAVGNVSAGNGSSFLGGLAGDNNGYWGGDLITLSHAAGNVSGGINSTYVGGLVGANIWLGAIANSYATGRTTGGTNVGGLVGWNGYTGSTVPASISSSYSAGLVGGASRVGGLVGYNNGGAITNSYWDSQATGTAIGLGGSNGGTFAATGLNTAHLKAMLPSGFDSSLWSIISGKTYPFQIPQVVQLDTVYYDFTTDAFSNDNGEDTCLAAVFAMIARTVGATYNDLTTLETMIDAFWVDPRPHANNCLTDPACGASWWQDTASELNLVQFLNANGVPIPRGTHIQIATVPISGTMGKTDAKTLVQWVASGGLAIIQASTSTTQTTSGLENHYVFATGAAGTVLYANDPWSGTKVAIDLNPNDGALYGTVTQIMDPMTGVYYSVTALPQSVMTDLQKSTPRIPNGDYAYKSLSAFNFRSSRGSARPPTGWIALTIQ
jgi:The GLUG motif